MNFLYDSWVESMLAPIFSASNYVKELKELWDMYSSISSLADAANYSKNWAPSGTYHITAALYWSEEKDHYFLFTKTTSNVESVLCYEEIRGVYPETIDWDYELSLKVVTRFQ